MKGGDIIPLDDQEIKLQLRERCAPCATYAFTQKISLQT